MYGEFQSKEETATAEKQFLDANSCVHSTQSYAMIDGLQHLLLADKLDHSCTAGEGRGISIGKMDIATTVYTS